MSLAVILGTFGGLVVLVLSIVDITRYAKEHPEVVGLALYSAIVVVGDSNTRLGTGGSRVWQGLAVTTMVVTTLLVLQRRRSLPVTSTSASPGLFLMLLVVWVLGVDIAVVPGISIAHALGRLLPILILSCFIFIGGTGVITTELMARVIAFVFGFAASLMLITPDPTRSCSGFKCGPFGSQLTGPFNNENAFGALAALTIIIALAVKSRPMRYAMILESIFVLYAADSRDAQVAAACGLVAALCWRRFHDALRFAIRPLLLLVPFALAYEGIHLVYSSGLSDFSDRGLIWYYGRTTLGSHWDIGAGIDSWKEQALSRDYMHSEYLLFLYSGGVFALLLFSLAMCSLLARAKDAADWPCVAFVIAFLVDGLVQIPWNPLAIEHGSVFGLLLVGLGFRTLAPPEPPAPEEPEQPEPVAQLPSGRPSVLRATSPLGGVPV